MKNWIIIALLISAILVGSRWGFGGVLIALLIICLPFLYYTVKGKIGIGSSKKDFWNIPWIRTVFFLVFVMVITWLFIAYKRPNMGFSPTKIFDGDWRDYSLFASFFIFSVVLLIMSIIFHRRIWLKSFAYCILGIIILALVGYRPISKMQGTQNSYSAFQSLKPDSTLMAMYKSVEEKPDTVLTKLMARHKNDYTNLHLRVEKDDIIVVYAKGGIRYGPNDFLGKSVRAGRAFARRETKNKLRDPEAHPFSPVLGFKSSKLGFVSSFIGSPGNPEDKDGTFFFLRVIADKGHLYLLPSNMPKKNYYYGTKGYGYRSDLNVKVYHLSNEKLTKLAS